MNKIKGIFLFIFYFASIGELFAGSIVGKIKATGVRDPRDVVAYVEKVEGKVFSPPKEHALLDQKNLVFTPHVLPLLAGTTVVFPNSDEVRHNVFSPAPAKKFNLGTYAKGETRTVTFDKEGIVVCLCNVHAEMSAYVVVLQNPYFDKTGKDGTFEIKNVPAGTYILKTWHEKLKPKSQSVSIPNDGTVEANFELRR